MSAILIIGFLGIFGLGAYVFHKLHDLKVTRELEKKIEQERLERIQYLKEQARLELEYEHKNRKYSLHTHKIKLTLFNAQKDLNELIYLYARLIIDNYWINEPFYSKFYELLLIIEQNDFMIVDSNAKVISMNLRDHNNKVQTSKAYQVFSSREIIEYVIHNSMYNVLKFEKRDGQNIVMAICIFILEKSLHYLSQEIPQNIINGLLIDYENSQDVRGIVALIKEKNSALKFVFDAFEEALNKIDTYPYNDIEAVKPLQLPSKLPQKSLQEL
jgi:hypothetical protein